MKRLLCYLMAALLFLGLLTGCGQDEDSSESTSSITGEELLWDLANGFYENLTQGNLEPCYAMFSEEMKNQLSYQDLQSLWEQILFLFGEYVSSGDFEASMVEEAVYYRVIATFSNTDALVEFSLKNEEIIGLYFTPYDPELQNTEGVAADVPLPEGVSEMEVTVNAGTDLELSGRITYPSEYEGGIPGVVLVHGSGPSDMDETIQSNKIFRDLAYGLASKGVAVLRYDKVTYTYGEVYGQEITIDQETVNDAVAAKEALASSGLNLEKIYVVGHSLGGMMAPKIAELGDFDGMVIMAGTPRSLIDVIYDQNLYLLSLYTGEEAKTQLEEVEELYREALEIMAGDEITADQTIFGLPATYFASMDIGAESARSYLEQTEKPMLILQGSNDFQVTADNDFAVYRQIVGGRENVTMYLYSGLNHLFMTSWMDWPTVEEYAMAGQVNEDVISHIGDWILNGDGAQ